MPRAPKPCGRRGCPETVRGRTYCDEHQPAPWTGHITTGSTRAWRAVRQQVLDDEPICTSCRAAPSTAAGHILARALGGTDHRDNLTGQCEPCNLAQLTDDLARARRP